MPDAPAQGQQQALRVVAFDDGNPWVRGFVDPNPAAACFYPIAVDPQSGTTMIGSSLARGDRLQNVPRYPGDALVGWSIASGSEDTFHALEGLEKNRVQYMQYANGAWSQPITVDDQAPTIFHRATAIVGVNRGTAIAVWCRNRSLMARWIRLRVQ